jgi:hypothetical protein
LGPTTGEKGLKHLPAFLCHDTAANHRLVVDGTVAVEVQCAACGPGLGVWRAIDDLWKSRMKDGPGTHGTGLEGHIQPTIGQTIIAQGPGCRSKGDDLCVSGGIVIADGGIRPDGYHLITLNDDRANRDLTPLAGQCGLLKSKPHKVQIVRHWPF